MSVTTFFKKKTHILAYQQENENAHQINYNEFDFFTLLLVYYNYSEYRRCRRARNTSRYTFETFTLKFSACHYKLSINSFIWL